MNYKSLGYYFLVIVITIFGLFLIKIFNISYPLTIITTSQTNELAVSGEGKVEAVPDIAYVDAGITVNNVSSVEEAQKIINKINNAIILSMKDLRVEKGDIKTSNYSIYPNYSYEGNQNKITGYNGNATVTIKVRNVQMATKVIEEATKAGANQIQGVNFSIDKPEKFREEARAKAIQNAKEQAVKLAKSLGIRLGKIVNLIEAAPIQNWPVYDRALSGGAGGAGPIIEPGNQTITSTVTLYFEKK